MKMGSRGVAFRCGVSLLCMLMLAACEPKTYTTLHHITFADKTLAPGVVEMQGFSYHEDWGRWTDASVAPVATIRFAQPLPESFSLVIKGQTVEKHPVAVVRVGRFEREFYIERFGDEVYIDVTNSEGADFIEIAPLEAVSPKSLDINGDTRKLGIGLIELRVEQ